MLILWKGGTLAPGAPENIFWHKMNFKLIGQSTKESNGKILQTIYV